MYRFEGRRLIWFGGVFVLIGVGFVIRAVMDGTGWLIVGGLGVAVVGAVQGLVGWEELQRSDGDR